MGNAIKSGVMVPEASKRVAAFLLSLGNGKTALVRLADEVSKTIESGNTVPLSRFIDGAIKKGDSNAASIIKKIVGQVWVGAELTNKRGEPTNIRIKGAQLSNSAVDALNAAVKNKLSIRSRELHAALNKNAPPVEPKPDMDKVTSAVRGILNNNPDLTKEKAEALFAIAFDTVIAERAEKAKKKTA